ncbi:MAG: sugar kinase [Colwellia sp.]|nr:sugar kinase [Colwellia sp.]
MKNIVVMGECMIEFSQSVSATDFRQSFAGDVFNTGIYIKRCMAEPITVNFLSAIGKDAMSEQLLSLMAEEQISTEMLYRTESAKMGLYLINLDSKGERSFSYWRNDSAAKQLITLMEKNHGLEQLKNASTFFFSGISLAILSESDRLILWKYLYQLKQQGTTIIFDPNYRASLWPSTEVTKAAYKMAFKLSHMALPGVDDFIDLYGVTDVEQVADIIEGYGVEEIVIKNGNQNMLISLRGTRSYLPVSPIKTVVDTTSAGDAFNGGYISARLTGKSVKGSAQYAAQVAACVIQHKGAIVPVELFEQKIQKLSVAALTQEITTSE